ncbi:MAG: glycosyltransferase family 39 protein [Oscillospiraceae bacterium]|nr:glycosyltransferase family 39 protein [Oscillospiraceae bacterium]
MKQKISDKLLQLFFAVFSVAFVCLFWNVLFSNKWFHYNPLYVLLLSVAGAAFLLIVYLALRMFKQPLYQKRYAIWGTAIIVLFFIQLIFARTLEVQTGGDFGEVYRAALTMTREGNLDDFKRYLYLFPNNLGLYVTLMLPFRLFNRFGFTNFYLIASVINIIMIDTGIVFTVLYCEKALGKRQAFLALLLCSACSLLYFLAPIFYSDTMSIAFAPILLYLNLCIKQAQKPKAALGLTVLMGFLAAFGFKIKATVLIVAVALILEQLLTVKLTKSISFVVCLTVSFAVAGAAFDAVAYSAPLSRDEAQGKSTPYTHWVMMGMHGDGAYNPQDYEISFGPENIITDSTAVKQTNLAVIKERLAGYGFAGYLSFLKDKGVRSFGSGNGQAAEFLNLRPRHNTLLHQFCLPEGKYYGIFDYYCQGWHVGVFLAAIAAAVLCTIDKQLRGKIPAAPFIATFGLYLFLLLWEANQRYLVNFIFVFIIMSVTGLTCSRQAAIAFLNRKKSGGESTGTWIKKR